MLRRAAIALALLLAPSVTFAVPTAPAAAAAAMPADPGKSFDSLLSMFETQVMDVAKAMPADKYDFTPSAATFASGQNVKFDGVRSFAGEVKHLAQANYYFFGSAGGLKPDTDVKAIGNLKTKDEILAALSASFAFAHKAMGKLTTANAFDEVEADGKQSRATAAAFGIAHGFDHYGQMVEYLRMNGIVPPGSK